MKAYKIRRFQNGRSASGEPFMNYSITIPSVIAEKLPNDMRFECELTDEGLLFKPVTGENVELPAWAAERNGSH
jgi:hypothetical protein